MTLELWIAPAILVLLYLAAWAVAYHGARHQPEPVALPPVRFRLPPPRKITRWPAYVVLYAILGGSLLVILWGLSRLG